MLDIERLTFGHELHALTEAPSALGLVGEQGVQREVGAVADAVCRLVGFAQVWKAGQCLGHLYEGGLYFAGPHVDVVEKLGILDHHAADGGVSDAAGRGFCEDAVGHCMVEEAKDKGLGQAARWGDFGIGSGAIEGYGFVDVIGVDDVQDGDVGGLPLFYGSFSGLWIGVAGRGATHAVQYLACKACGAQYEFSNGLGGIDDGASDALE